MDSEKTSPPVVYLEDIKRRRQIWLAVLDTARIYVLNPTPDHALMLRAEVSIFYANLEVAVYESQSNPVTVTPKELTILEADGSKYILIGWCYNIERQSIVRERIDLNLAPAFVINRAEKDIQTMGHRDPFDLLMAAAVDQAMYNPHGLKYSLTQLEIIDKMKSAEIERKLEPLRI